MTHKNNKSTIPTSEDLGISPPPYAPMDIVRAEGSLFRKMGEKHVHRPVWVRVVIIFLAFMGFIPLGIFLVVLGVAPFLTPNSTNIILGIGNLFLGSIMSVFGLIVIWRNIRK